MLGWTLSFFSRGRLNKCIGALDDLRRQQVVGFGLPDEYAHANEGGGGEQSDL